MEDHAVFYNWSDGVLATCFKRHDWSVKPIRNELSLLEVKLQELRAPRLFKWFQLEYTCFKCSSLIKNMFHFRIGDSSCITIVMYSVCQDYKLAEWPYVAVPGLRANCIVLHLRAFKLCCVILSQFYLVTAHSFTHMWHAQLFYKKSFASQKSYCQMLFVALTEPYQVDATSVVRCSHAVQSWLEQVPRQFVASRDWRNM